MTQESLDEAFRSPRFATDAEYQAKVIAAARNRNTRNKGQSGTRKVLSFG